MTRMKDSGIEWIGEVPEEWGIKPIKHILVPLVAVQRRIALK